MAGRVCLFYGDYIDCRDVVADFKLGTKRVGVLTDGGLQILLPRDEDFVEWDRSYYEIALEVALPLFIHSTLYSYLGKTLLWNPNQEKRPRNYLRIRSRSLHPQWPNLC